MVAAPILDFDRPYLLTVTETAALLGVGKSTVYRLMQRGELKYKIVGTERRVIRTSVENYAKEAHDGEIVEPV